MKEFEDLKKWTDDTTNKHIIQILQDSNLSKEEIISELNLTEEEFNRIVQWQKKTVT